jgi:hypothetical protein
MTTPTVTRMCATLKAEKKDADLSKYADYLMSANLEFKAEADGQIVFYALDSHQVESVRELLSNIGEWGFSSQVEESSCADGEFQEYLTEMDLTIEELDFLTEDELGKEEACERLLAEKFGCKIYSADPEVGSGMDPWTVADVERCLAVVRESGITAPVSGLGVWYPKEVAIFFDEVCIAGKRCAYSIKFRLAAEGHEPEEDRRKLLDHKGTLVMCGPHLFDMPDDKILEIVKIASADLGRRKYDKVWITSQVPHGKNQISVNFYNKDKLLRKGSDCDWHLEPVSKNDVKEWQIGD